MPKKRLTIEYIKEQFKKERYELLTKEYINNKQKLDYICPEGHRHSIRWNDWQRKQRCPCQSNLMKPTIEFIRSEFAKVDYILLTTEYVNSKQKLGYICPKGHKHNIIWNSWQRGHRCPCQSNQMIPTIDFIRSEFVKERYKLLTTKYKNAYQRLDYVCPEGHRHSVSWANWKQNCRCPECTNKISKEEVQVRNFVKSLSIEVSSNDRSQIFSPKTGKSLELDIFMPVLNKAIEYNGEYWHQDKNRDLLKQQLCKDKNINLLVITDKEWNENIEKCKSKVVNFIEN